ncbi:SMC-Scp complex subunit ScpB [Pararhizobium sp. BT-229]|uniref:SMC-Scp complex subunit ScpB n=1 Tax=Pararhizobium sp. BT-229 TaxID=2986923 RepID=UPI0021F7A20A|nr:SMC-Scp complex subunit ScpB [Pararhizobium sp. BT-229]MCV9964658.1 SMC-Scp complex subunit ScpB [Pararhizobium sp. BT-229]
MASTASLQIEALLLASPAPTSIEKLAKHFGRDVSAEIAEMAAFWSARGMNVRIRDGAVSLTPSEAVLKALSRNDARKGRKLTDAAVETLCFIAVHQPVTSKDIEAGRGLALYKGVVDSLMDAGFVRAALRKTDSGRAVTYVTTDLFLDHFGLSSLGDLPSKDELLQIVNETPDQTENEVPQPQVDVALGLETSNLSPTSEEM